MAPEAGLRDLVVSIDLRPAQAADVAWLEGWLPQVAGALAYEVADLRAWLKKVRARIIVRDGVDVGVVAYRPRAAERSAVIELVATPQMEARRGAGMAAAARLESELLGAGVRTIYAPAPAVHGISMYFWIRLGYRPLLRTEWPCERAGVAWLMRIISADRAT